MEGVYTLTEDDNDYFLGQVSRWKHVLGLHRYHIDVQELEYSIDVAGNCTVDEPQQHAIIGITQEWDHEPSPKNLSKIAFHECLEIMLNKLRTGSVFNDDIVSGWIHEVIGVFETVLFEKIWEMEDE